MGAYLSSPICDKDTIEGVNNCLEFAASSMQGWRMSQEDAHNAILDFDKDTSLFAVYDGHGGSEIAVYCSQYFPEFIKNLDSYKEGRVKDALTEAFLKFDSLLLDPEVKKVLQKLASNDNEDDEKVDECNQEVVESEQIIIEETQILKQEAELPIEEVLKRYNEEETECQTSKITNENDIEIQIHREKTSDTTEENKTNENLEEKPSSSHPQSTTRRIRKPVSANSSTPLSTIFQSSSLTRHLLSDNTDELDAEDDDDDDDDEDDFELDASEEDTSDDESDGQESDEDGDENENDESSAEKNTIQIKKLMRKSILAILNRRAKDKTDSKQGDNDDDIKENKDAENDGSGEENNADDNDKPDDEEDDIDEEDESDLDMLEVDNDPGSSSGCTAVVTIVRDKQIYVANVGDSRCVVCRDGRAVDMSFDHKPEDPQEKSRIEKAGFKVTLDGRVSGGLNLSRAIGDHAYKKKALLAAEEQAITALPDIRTLTLEDQDEFMIIACDGIWNFMSSQDVIDFVRYRLAKKNLRQICEELFMHCLAPNTLGDGTGCDNMTAIIVKFNFNKPSAEAASPKSINNKRALSPDRVETIDNGANKKLKVLTENSTNETNSKEEILS